jgi:pilus assembly protein TadC
MIKIPFSFIPNDVLRKLSFGFFGISSIVEKYFPFLKVNLKQAEMRLSPKEYISMCIVSTIFFFLIFGFLFMFLMGAFGVQKAYMGFVISFIFAGFTFLQQMMYPKMLVRKRIKGIERNLLASLQNMLIQLNSGVPLFNILVSISKGDYKEVSEEIGKAVREINAGKPQVDALEEIATTNPSLLFRRALWQIVNGMKSGSDMSGVINESIVAIAEEQVLQIQRYGGQLNPLAMFYMLVAVIVPALSMTFLITMSSFMSLNDFGLKLLFWGLFGMVMFFQLMFLGVIKSRRPNLLGE